ncbi:MAG: hypothetical protein K0S02_2442 [Achromobacter mucicolens]|jgi:hypothetical protein|nr:hypothetical protein [Achromobacter mucicolens]
MAQRHRDHQRFLHELRERQPAVQRKGRAHERGVDRAVAQLRHKRFAVALRQRHFNFRVALAVLADQLGHHAVERRRLGEPQRQFAHLAARGALGRAHGRIGALQDVLRARQECASGVVQRHPAARAVKKGRAHFLFKLADLLAERRLCHAQQLGRAREMLGLGCDDEIAKMAQFHIDI